MKIQSLRTLQGPNIWGPCRLLEARLDVGAGWTPEEVQRTLDHLPKHLSGAISNWSLPPSEQLAKVFNHLVLALQTQAGTPVAFEVVRPTSTPQVVLAGVEFVEETVGQAAAEIARRLLEAARQKPAEPTPEELQRLRDLEYAQRLPISTAVIYHAARVRGIPAALLSPEYGRFLLLGQGSKQHRCLGSEPDSVSGVARNASTDKYLAKWLMQCAGIPVPQGKLVGTVEEAWAAAEKLGLPVAVKPYDSDLQTGVSLDVRNREGVEAAFRMASEHSSWVLIEQFAPGMEHRVLVVGNRVVAVARIEPPHVIGDGVSTVVQLVERVNQDPRRKDDERNNAPLSPLKLDTVAESVLAMQGFTVESIPPKGLRVLVRRNPPYFKNGGNLIDLTDRIHPSTAGHAVAAAQVLRIPVAGIDVVAVDIGVPLEEQGGVLVEINAGPGLWLHLAPWADSPRPVGDDIVASLYPPGNDGRIPVVALVGDSGEAARHLTELLARAGQRVGTSRQGEIALDGRRWATPTGSPQDRATLLLRNPAADVAVLEITPDELLSKGFGNDRCDFAVVLGSENRGDELASDGDDFRVALRHALGARGIFVLAPGVARGDLGVSAERIILVGEEADISLLAGQQVLTIKGDRIVFCRGEQTEDLGKRPERLGSEEALGLLGALATGLALGQTIKAVRAYLGRINERKQG